MKTRCPAEHRSILRSPVMKSLPVVLNLALLGAVSQAATITVGPWAAIYKGVELASGQQQAQTTGERNQQVLCYRVDLADPDIELFTTPKCTNCNLETVSENPSHFLEQYRVQVAVNGGFYSSSSGPGDTALGTPEDVFGLAISRGVVVSPPNNASYAGTVFFTTNNEAYFVPSIQLGTNTASLYTAVSGNHALLSNGVNLRPLPRTTSTRAPPSASPRTGGTCSC